MARQSMLNIGLTKGEEVRQLTMIGECAENGTSSNFEKKLAVWPKFDGGVDKVQFKAIPAHKGRSLTSPRSRHTAVL